MFTLDDVVTSALKAVGAKGAEYVYENTDCVYAEVDESDEATPSCLVGWVMYDLDEELFREVAGSRLNEDAWSWLTGCGFVPMEWATEEAMHFLGVVQGIQDMNEATWLEAINTALQRVGEK